MKTIKDYADLVKEKHALNTTIAPVETDLTSASKTYAVGQKFIIDGVLYQAKTPIAQGTALVLNTNYEAADDVSSEIQTLTNKLNGEIETRARLGVHNLLPNQVSTTTGDMTGITKNEDGTVTIEPRTGLSEGGLYFSVRGTKDFFLPNGRYIISGGLNNDIYISGGYTNTSGEYQSFGVDYGSGLAITINGSNLRDDGAYITFWVGVRRDISSQVTIYPMLRLATDSDTSFQPYAMTNRELTEIVNNVGTVLGGQASVHPTTADTFFEIRRVTLTKGVWIVHSFSNVSFNASGVYINALQWSSSRMESRASMVNGGGNDVMRIFEVDDTLDVISMGYANSDIMSDASRTQSSLLQAIRIK